MKLKHYIMGVGFGDSIAQMGKVFSTSESEAKEVFEQELTILSADCPGCAECFTKVEDQQA